MSDPTPDVSDEDDATITLYRLQACPFCERVARKLSEYDLDYHSRFVEPLHSKRNAVKRVSGQRGVPVIVDDRTGVTMSESERIVQYLDRTYGGPDDGPAIRRRRTRAGRPPPAW